MPNHEVQLPLVSRLGTEVKVMAPNRSADIFRAALFLLAVMTALGFAADPAGALVVDFRQGSNKNPTQGNVVWIGSIMQESNSTYYEGTSALQRLVFIDIPSTTGNVHALKFSHQANKSTSHAYDFITSWSQALQAGAAIGGPTMFVTLNECGEVIGPPKTLGAICTALHSSGYTYVVDAPDVMGSVLGDDVAARVGAYEAVLGNRTVKLYGNSPISSASLTFDGYSGSGDLYAEYTLTWVSASDRVALELAGHLASGLDPLNAGVGYGVGRGSASISGGPYHFKLATLDGASLGSQDNQIKGADIHLPPPVCNVAPGTQWTCQGGSVTFADNTSGGGGGYTYCWQKAPYTGPCLSSTNLLEFTNASEADSGWYRVIVTDANSLKDTCYAYLGVWEHPQCNLSPGIDSVCIGSSTTFTDNTSGGAGGYTYCWQKAPYTGPCLSVASFLDIVNATLSDSGWYRVVVADANGCTDTSYAYLGLYESPICSVTPTSVSVCAGGSATFTDASSGGTGSYNYCWQKAPYTGPCLSESNTLQITNAQLADAGTYRVIVSDVCACSDTCYVSLTVWEPPPCEISGFPSVCAGHTTQWCAPSAPGGMTYNYSWTGPESFSSSERCVDVGVAGTYTLRVTDQHGCECEATKSLIVYGLPGCSITRTGGELSVLCPCFEGQDPLPTHEFCGPAGMTSYLWTIEGAAEIVGYNDGECVEIRTAALCDTFFTLTVTVVDLHGCSNTCSRTLYVDDDEPPVFVYCPPDTVLECSDDMSEVWTPIIDGGDALTRIINAGGVWSAHATDNCDPIPVAEYADTGERPTNWQPRVDSWGSCGEDTTILRVWTATDQCGNQATCTQVIAIQDTIPPSMICAPDGTVPCGTEVVFTPPTGLADNCDPLRLVEIVEVSTDIVPGPGPGEYTHTRCWTATDSCQNAAPICCQSIVVEACPEFFCTFTNGGWGSECPPDQAGNMFSTQPGCIRDHYFYDVFPDSQVMIGDPEGLGAGHPTVYAAEWTSPAAIEAFLPAGETSGALTEDLTNPVVTPAGVLAGQILALRLNVEYSCAGVFETVELSTSSACYRDFIIPESCGKFAGLTVGQFLSVADLAVGGKKNALAPFSATLPDVNYTATCLNEEFVGCGPTTPLAPRDINEETAGSVDAERIGDEQSSFADAPGRFSVQQSYPNPFNPSANIVFGLPGDGNVRVEVYDIVGRKLVTLLDEHRQAGYHNVVWSGKDADSKPVASGVYFCKVTFGHEASIVKLILLK